MRYPRLPADNRITAGGVSAVVSLSIKGSRLDLQGFDTEGITSIRQVVKRKIQIALVIAGQTYFTHADADYKFDKSGQLKSPRP